MVSLAPSLIKGNRQDRSQEGADDQDLRVKSPVMMMFGEQELAGITEK